MEPTAVSMQQLSNSETLANTTNNYIPYFNVSYINIQ